MAGTATTTSPWSPDLRRTTLGVVALVSLVAFEAMAVATAMPVAARELDGLSLYAWSFTGFLVSSLFGTAVAGDLTDRFGPRPTVLIGVALFAVGLALAGAAGSMVPFIVGRLVQGLGGGALIVGVYVLVGSRYPDELRPRMFAYLSAAWVLPAVVGPVVAGTLAENLSWRLVFYGLLPLVVAPVLLLLEPLADARPGGTEERRAGRVLPAAALAVGAATLQFGGQQVQRERVALGVLLLVAGALALAPALRTLTPPGTLRLRRGLPSVVALRGAQAGAFAGAEAFLPLMLVEHRGLSPTLAGACLTGAALGWWAGSWWQGRPGLDADRQRLAITGAAIVLVGLGGSSLALLDEVPALVAAPGWVVTGAGMGITFSTLSVLLFRLSPRADQGANSAALQISDALGSILTVGLGGVLYAALRRPGDGGDGMEFVVVFAAMLVVQLLAILLARRVLPRRAAGEEAAADYPQLRAG